MRAWLHKVINEEHGFYLNINIKGDMTCWEVKNTYHMHYKYPCIL